MGYSSLSNIGFRFSGRKFYGHLGREFSSRFGLPISFSSFRLLVCNGVVKDCEVVDSELILILYMIKRFTNSCNGYIQKNGTGKLYSIMENAMKELDDSILSFLSGQMFSKCTKNGGQRSSHTIKPVQFTQGPFAPGAQNMVQSHQHAIIKKKISI